MVCHYPVKFVGHSHCCSGDTTFLVAEEENSRCSRFNLPSLFISKGHGLKAQVCHINNSHPGHTRNQRKV